MKIPDLKVHDRANVADFSAVGTGGSGIIHQHIEVYQMKSA